MNYTYIVKCADETLYTGWTNHLDKRIAAHNAGKGAKYTKNRRPVELVYYEEFDSKEAAMQREWEIKQLSRQKKMKLAGLECKQNRHINRDNGGFTLVEMILVITLLAIISSFSLFGLMKWQEASNFRQQNEYAQILFLSAQSQLTKYESTGRIERFVSTLQDSDGNLKRVLDVTRLTDGNGDVYPSGSAVWYESAGSLKQEEPKYQGELCYACCMPGDYEMYRNGGREGLSQTAKDRGADIVFMLLESYVYDKSILNASISVEFSPYEGQVFAVCYRLGGGEFIYAAPSETAPDGKINIANRGLNYRKEQGVGYYGADTLAKATRDTVWQIMSGEEEKEEAA